MVGVNAGVVLALGLAMLIPLAFSLLYRDGSWASFLVPAVIIPLGAVGLRASRLRGGGYVLERDVFFAVTLAWVSPETSAPSRRAAPTPTAGATATKRTTIPMPPSHWVMLRQNRM